MPVAKLRSSDTLEVMKSDEKNDSLDTIIRQAIGKEPLHTFSKPGDSPVQWIQLLHALDQQDLPGWPLLTPLKVQMQKCEKCSREFCSPVNFRRHMRLHRRSLNFDKDSTKTRDLLGAFWDKLSAEESVKIFPFKDVLLEDVPGSSIVLALTSFIRKPGFTSLPQVYLKAGSALLDIIQSRPSRYPISSQELFTIFDDASERTFLRAGTADSIRKYVFDGEVGKTALELKNLIASTCFLMEEKLVKTWLADKDAEALRCQKLLVEEEEAASKRQVAIMERKRKKKLRQKELKAKEQDIEETYLREDTEDTSEDSSSADKFTPPSPSHSDIPTLEAQPDQFSSFLEPIQFLDTEESTEAEDRSGFGNGNLESGTYYSVEQRIMHGNGQRRQLVTARWQGQKSHRYAPNALNEVQNHKLSKHGAMPRNGNYRDSKTAPIGNGNKVWSLKPRSENFGSKISNNREQKEGVNQACRNKDHELLIGSIPVTLGNYCGPQQVESSNGPQEDSITEHPVAMKNNVQEKPMSRTKLWRPVSRHGPETGVAAGNGGTDDDILSFGMDHSHNGSKNSFNSLEENSQCVGLQFSSQAAETFLAQRWKEAIAADHVKLVLYFEPELELLTPDSPKRSILGNAENRLGKNGVLESLNSGTSKAKFRTKSEKGAKLKYIPRQRSRT